MVEELALPWNPNLQHCWRLLQSPEIQTEPEIQHWILALELALELVLSHEHSPYYQTPMVVGAVVLKRNRTVTKSNSSLPSHNSIIPGT